MRKFLQKTKLAALGLLTGLALAGCGSDEGAIKHVPRNRTLILGLPQMRDYDSFNPFIVGTQSLGFDYLFEPLYFYNGAQGLGPRLRGSVEQKWRAPDDPALVPLFRQALEIWLAELPAIPLLQWFHRIPHNQTYWTNWPSAENPYMNSAYWVRSFLIVLLGLEPAQP